MKKYILFILIGLTMASCNKEEKEREENKEEILNMFRNNKFISNTEVPITINFGRIYRDPHPMLDIDSVFITYADGSCSFYTDGILSGLYNYHLFQNNDEIILYHAIPNVDRNFVYHILDKRYNLKIINENIFELGDQNGIISFYKYN